jgi:topoisomerase IA-like protein
MTCENCGCNCSEIPKAPKRIDYNSITPEKAAEMIAELIAKPHPMAKLDERFKTPRFWVGKSHLTALMARRDGREFKVLSL